MMFYNTLSQAKQNLLDDNIGVIPTDTIYGIVGRAFSSTATEEVFRIKKRPVENPLITLIADWSDLATHYGVTPTPEQQAFSELHWPGPVSLGFPYQPLLPEYIHRGSGVFFVRLPDNEALRNLLRSTGPLFATSANITGNKPAQSAEEAYAVFGNTLDFYVTGITLDGNPSIMYDLSQKPYTQLR
ncbi:MAG: L-threonylcarbamoyladenylate synthase [Planctomycetota bacterium]|jgi:L-threonylcarbamoyladenylate synthase